MNLCASSQWKMVTGLFFVVTKLAHAYYRMGGHAFKILGQFDSIFVKGLVKENFHSVGEKSFLRCEFIGSRWITHTVGHSN